MVKAHERFLLFATQNPPGLYGGRKVSGRIGRGGVRLIEAFEERDGREVSRWAESFRNEWRVAL